RIPVPNQCLSILIRKLVIKKIETLLNDDLKKFRKTKLSMFLTTEFIFDLCFARERWERDWLNNYEFASLVLRSLSGIDEFNKLVQVVTLWVMRKYQDFQKSEL
ncbi:MAG: hypothetical protein ACUVQW_07250, partial [Candidatus Bathycorpusculaceae bacterium]